jgi:hypothetical protein
MRDIFCLTGFDKKCLTSFTELHVKVHWLIVNADVNLERMCNRISCREFRMIGEFFYNTVTLWI